MITFSESTSVNVTIKNVSGKSISSMYIAARGYYQRSDDPSLMGQCANAECYLYGGPYYEKKSCSWANGTSKTFSFTYTFTKGYFPVDMTSYVMQKQLFLTIVTESTFSNGCNYDNFTDVSEGLMTILSKRDNPQLSMTLERAHAGIADDEGEQLLTDLLLTSDIADFASHGYTASIRCTPDLTGGCVLTVSIADMITGVTNSATAISGTFSNLNNYDITITVTNGYETAVATQSIAKCFANVHMSGKSTGGICFGGFSSAGENEPKFESYYPAYFYGGIEKIAIKTQVPTYSSGYGAESGNAPRVTRVGPLVFLEGGITRSASSASGSTSSWTYIATLPSWAYPRARVSVLMQSSNSNIFNLGITTNGAVFVHKFRTTASTSVTTIPSGAVLPITACWIAADAYN